MSNLLNRYTEENLLDKIESTDIDLELKNITCS